MRPRIAPLAVTLALAAAPVRPQGGPPGAMPPTPVSTVKVVREELARTVPLSGVVQPIRRSLVASAQEGLVKERLVEFGSRVEARALLARLDDKKEIAARDAAKAAADETFQAWKQAERGERVEEVLMAEAELDRADASALETSINLKRYQDLFSRKAATQDQLDTARRAADVAAAEQASARAKVSMLRSGKRKEEQLAAEARYRGAKARLDAAQAALDEMQIVAPFAGSVAEVMIDKGDWVGRGGKVLELVDISTLDVVVLVPEELVAKLKPASKVTCEFHRLDPPLTREGVLVAIGDQATLAGRTIPAVIRFANPDGAVLARFSATALMPVGDPAPRILAPKDALVRGTGGTIKAFVNEGGKAALRMVEIGSDFGDRVEILSGLAAGDEVVVRGNERLQPGAAISASPLAISTAPAGGKG